MHLVEAELGSLLYHGLPVLAAMGRPAATVVDPADLPHVDVHQAPGKVTLVAARGRLGREGHLAGERVELMQVRRALAAHNPRDSAGCLAEVGAEPVLDVACLNDSIFDIGRCVSRTARDAERTGSTQNLIQAPATALAEQPMYA